MRMINEDGYFEACHGKLKIIIIVAGCGSIIYSMWLGQMILPDYWNTFNVSEVGH
jgi:hypothetical protein